MKKAKITLIAVPNATMFQPMCMSNVYICKNLRLSDYQQVVNSQLIICENSQITSHIIVVCRIKGVPVIEVDAIDLIEIAETKYIYLDFENMFVNVSDKKVHSAPNRKKFLSPTLKQNIKYQLSIINDAELICDTTKHEDIEQFFLRSELLWLSLQKNPYNFINEYGCRKTSSLIADELFKIYTRMESHQILNFRGLDLRSNESFFADIFEAEMNPQMGLHGTRQLLYRSDYLISELMTIDMLYTDGLTNVVYSLPFVTNKKEVDDVIQIRDKFCKNKIKIGLFAETPSAVFDLPIILNSQILYVYLGIKDLAQFMLAVDRDNKKVAHLMDMTSASIIYAIKYAVEVCEQKGIPIFIFSMPSDIEKILTEVPDIKRLSVAAADYTLVAGR